MPVAWLFVRTFRTSTFRTVLFVQVLFVRYFSYNYFSYELFVQVLFIQLFFVRTFRTGTFRTNKKGGGAKLLAKGTKNPRLRSNLCEDIPPLMRGLLPPPPCICTKSSYEKYLYEKSVRKLIVRKVPYEK